jgi:uncharacterized protein YeeX (DUF496 family)
VLKRLKSQIQHNMEYGEVERTFVSADRPSKPIHLEGLCIEGRATGSQRSNEDEMTSDLDWNGVIKGVLDLVLRMETDRQETLNKLSEEKEKVHYLSQKLDVESKRRLCSLESAVQSEYERSVDEFKEFHSVVEKERRELSEFLCDLSVTGTIYVHTQFSVLSHDVNSTLFIGERSQP